MTEIVANVSLNTASVDTLTRATPISYALPAPHRGLASGSETLLDRGLLPVEQLAQLAQREAVRPRPIYGAHRWFARRFGSAFRALLVSSVLNDGQDFWDAYYGNTSTDLPGKTLLDCFVGGGTSVVEALRLGLDVIGIDVDAVACAITRFESNSIVKASRGVPLPNLSAALEQLKLDVGVELAPYHRTVLDDGTERDVLHWFWVQIVNCAKCRKDVECHPDYQLAYEAEGTRQWVFCKQCHTVHEMSRKHSQLRCTLCTTVTRVKKGTVQRGKLTCPHCRHQERLIDVAERTGAPPHWKLFAKEILEPPYVGHSVAMSQRKFMCVTAADLLLVERARTELAQREQPDGSVSFIPERKIPPENRTDNRLIQYGYRKYKELFNPRQLLHLSLLGDAIEQVQETEVREALALAFSDHLATNCMMTSYTHGWRRLAPLFSIRAYRHVPRPVEINPWMDGTGRGTFPNTVRQVQRALDFAVSPKEAVIKGGFDDCPLVTPEKAVPDNSTNESGHRANILHRSAQDMSIIPDESVDITLTDPPYFDNVAYSELADFYLPWLQLFGMAPADEHGEEGLNGNLAAKSRRGDSLNGFSAALGLCFSEVARVLKPDGRLVFTYQHKVAGAWHSLAMALHCAGFEVVQVFPLLGDSPGGLQTHEGSSRWDAVFVARIRPDRQKGGCGAVLSMVQPMSISEIVEITALKHHEKWVQRLRVSCKEIFRTPDEMNFKYACLVAGALGMFAQPSTLATADLSMDGSSESADKDLLVTLNEC